LAVKAAWLGTGADRNDVTVYVGKDPQKSEIIVDACYIVEMMFSEISIGREMEKLGLVSIESRK
jgi:hypothetical protein